MNRKECIIVTVLFVVCIIGYICTSNYIEYKNCMIEEETTVDNFC